MIDDGVVHHVDDGVVRRLIERTLGGDPAAWGALVEAYDQTVWKLCRNLARGQVEAEDLYQDTFVRAQVKLCQFTGNGSFQAWLLQICRNRWRDELDKKKVRAGEISIDGLATSRRSTGLMLAQQHGPLTIPDHEEALIRNLDLQAALNTLDPDEREALVLMKMLEMTSQEAAEIIGTPASTLRSRLGKARAKLEKLLQDYQNE